jgi:Lar family restriction alleviation protein
MVRIYRQTKEGALGIVEMTELLNCPFCDGHAKLTVPKGLEAWVSCEECGASAPMATHADFAIKMWNKRAAPSIQLRDTERDDWYIPVPTSHGGPD